MSRRSFVLGVDGGGTKTLGFLADEYGNILTRQSAGATNPNLVGFETAGKNIVKLITDCCEDGRCLIEELKAVVLGIAGASIDANRRKLHDTLESTFNKGGTKSPPIIVETDARVALEGAFAGGQGVVIIAGTGSVVTGKTQKGEVLSTGGWGRILGDEGSGYYIGREAVRLVTLMLDRRGEKTKLRDVFADKFHWKIRDDIIHAVYQEKFDLASLAPVVFETAAANDVPSQKLLQQSAAHLAEQARVIVMQMGILRKIGLVMLGGLLDAENVYANVLHMKLMKLLPQVEIKSPVHPPAHGAVLMALEKLKRA